MEEVRGTVNKVVYYNEDNGYGIVRLKLDYKNSDMVKYRSMLYSNILSVLCTFDRKPIIDEEISFVGTLEMSSYGYQLKAKSFKRVNEETEEGIITYLSSEYFPKIGKLTAKKVFDTLGSDCLQKICKNRKVLDKVDITESQKNVIYENLVIHYKNERELVELLNIGISMNLSVKIMKILGDDAANIVKSNPYKLIDLVEGIAFLRADDIANNLGIKKTDPIRLEALILYCLKTEIYKTGNTYIPFNDLRVASFSLANTYEEVVNKDNFDSTITKLVESGKITVDSNNNVYEYHVYLEEIKVARRMMEFLNHETREYDYNLIPNRLDEVMKVNKIQYSPKQVEAITKALSEPVVIITGGPGTGKSTIIKGIIDCYSAMFNKPDLISDKILLVAPTGRASKRLKEVTHHNASTIHKLLGYEGHGRFTVTEDNPIDAKMIIIDEFSMVDVSLASLLFSCILPTTKVVIVGDSDQLPAVGTGNVLEDLIESKEITTVKLDKIHRQASDSTIISLAHSINQGELPYDICDKKKDRSFIQCNDEILIDFICKVVKQGLEKKMDLIKDIQVLVPMYRGLIGIDAINTSMQDIFNKNDREINYNGKRFRVNDKVIQLVNRSEKQVMNGDIGYILHIDYDSDSFKSLDVMFDFGSVHYEKEELDDLSLAYAISIHKAQGSEFGLVVVPFSFKYYGMLKRKLIYTAITRAKKFLVMLGNIEAFRKGIVYLEEKRKTKLTDRIKALIDDPKIIFDNSSAFKRICDDGKVTIEDFMNDDFIKNEVLVETIEEMENISPYDFMENDK